MARPKNLRGGAPAKPVEEKTTRTSITIHPADLAFLLALDPNLSKAIRKAVAQLRDG